MFVAIDNRDKSPIDVEDLIQITRSNGEITPEFAMEVLSLTNHSTNIKKLVRAIKDKCKTKEDILPYKEFIVSSVDGREVSEEALADLRDIASLCCCDNEFEVAKDKPKFYGKFDCNNTLVVKSREEFEALEGENLKVYFDADNVDFVYCDLSKVKALKFKEGAEVDLMRVKNLPKDLDVSMCDTVSLSGCDLEGINLKFREGAFVDLSWAVNLPKVLDLSKCSNVRMSGCDLSSVYEIKLKDRVQEMEFMKGTENFKGKVSFDKDKGGAGMVPPGYGGAEM